MNSRLFIAPTGLYQSAPPVTDATWPGGLRGVFVPRDYQFLGVRPCRQVPSPYQSSGGFGTLPFQPVPLFSSAFYSLAALSLLMPTGAPSQVLLGQFYLWLCGSFLTVLVSGWWERSLCNVVLGGC